MSRVGWTGRAATIWQRAHSSLWFIPTLLVLASLGLSTALLRLDDALGTGYAGGWWLFGGSAEGARTVLSVIAGSLITVIAVAFSVTMIAIQQASTQFSPRVLRKFTRDRGNQIVLGAYIATFTYALLVLRRVRESAGGDGGFVPAIAISVAMLLALVSLGLLVYFIHHASDALQVTSLLTQIRRELDRDLTRLFPDTVGRAEETEEESNRVDFVLADTYAARFGREVTVTSNDEGYLRRISEDELAANGKAQFLRVEVQVGDYVRREDTLLRAWCDESLGDDFVERMRGAFQLDRERSQQQDPLFGIRQLVDIGVKALSPGINDPTTAEQTLDQLGGAIGLLLDRSFPSPLRVLDGGARVLLRTPTFADFVDAAFAQMRRAARSDLHVSFHLIGILRKLLERAKSPSRAAVLRRQIEDVVANFDEEVLTDDERALLRRAQWLGSSAAMEARPHLAH